MHIPPFKETQKCSEIRFSEWLESLRKDVECTFGILKGRWRVLKVGIRMHGILSCNRIWLTCVALHTIFLEADGLQEKWNEGFMSDWETMHDMDEMPNAIRKLLKPGCRRHPDISGSGYGNDHIPSEDTNDDSKTDDNPTIDADGSIRV